MSFALILRIAGGALLTLLFVVWWLRRGRAGLNWLLLAAPLAFLASYGSSFLFRVPDYQAGCEGFCPGWWGHPLPTHISDGLGPPEFAAAGLAANAAIYYAALVIAGAIVALAAGVWRWAERSRGWRSLFLLAVVLLPLALTPAWIAPPAPTLPQAEQRLANNAARAWRWQLRLRRFSDRGLAVEDVRLHPDGRRQRVCFRLYTWFYLPHNRLYIDLEPAGVLSTGGGVIPLTASCWVQP